MSIWPPFIVLLPTKYRFYVFVCRVDLLTRQSINYETLHIIVSAGGWIISITFAAMSTFSTLQFNEPRPRIADDAVHRNHISGSHRTTATFATYCGKYGEVAHIKHHSSSALGLYDVIGVQ